MVTPESPHFSQRHVELAGRNVCAESGTVGAAAAAPPCASFSRARLRPGGPPPVRTVQYPTGIPSPTPAQSAELSVSSSLRSRARHFLSLVAARGGLILLKNPTPLSVPGCPCTQADRGPGNGGRLTSRSSIRQACPTVPNVPSPEPQLQRTEENKNLGGRKGSGTLDPEA